MISCLMVTQKGREQHVSASIECFVKQSFLDRELVIVHDSDAAFHQTLIDQCDKYPTADIRLFKHLSGESLGSLRNRSIENAKYNVVCQWDDDDLYHPDRLKVQYQYLYSNHADFCFMTDQLHLFVNEGFLFWDDWSIEKYPGNLIQGTLMGKKELLGQYPDLARGEDTELVFRLIEEGHEIASLSDMAWLYLYIYHGSNAWNSDHHKAISNFKRLKFSKLKDKVEVVEQELQQYSLQLEKITMPHEKGKFDIHL